MDTVSKELFPYMVDLDGTIRANGRFYALWASDDGREVLVESTAKWRLGAAAQAMTTWPGMLAAAFLNPGAAAIDGLRAPYEPRELADRIARRGRQISMRDLSDAFRDGVAVFCKVTLVPLILILGTLLSYTLLMEGLGVLMGAVPLLLAVPAAVWARERATLAMLSGLNDRLVFALDGERADIGRKPTPLGYDLVERLSERYDLGYVIEVLDTASD
jgi:hypothetical protein